MDISYGQFRVNAFDTMRSEDQALLRGPHATQDRVVRSRWLLGKGLVLVHTQEIKRKPFFLTSLNHSR